MKPGETLYLGDGAYLHFDGCGFELRANDRDYPTDRVYLELPVVMALIRAVDKTVEGLQ